MAFIRIALAVLLSFQAQAAPRKVGFRVEHFKADARQSVPLKPEEAKSFAAELKGLAAVEDATCAESSATVTLRPGATLKLSDLRSAGKKTLSYDGGKPVIVYNTLKLEGRVTLTLQVAKNPDRVKDALKEAGFKDVTESGSDWGGTVGTPVDVVTVVKKVAAKAGVDYRIFEILKDVAWHAPPAE